ncbi:hypothetical protein VTK26DRAFT_2967 [Humicola hyalothermophila]
MLTGRRALFRPSPTPGHSDAHAHDRPPASDLTIESWLDSIPLPPTKPSSTDLRQWRLREGRHYYHGFGRSVFVTCAILRAVSLVIALTVTGIIASVVAGNHGRYFVLERMVPVLVVCPLVVLWNAAEFVAMFMLPDGSISPNVLMWADALAFLGTAAATSILLVNIICGVVDFGAFYETEAHEISSACLMVILMIIHSFLLFFFLCNRLYNLKVAQHQHQHQQQQQQQQHGYPLRPRAGANLGDEQDLRRDNCNSTGNHHLTRSRGTSDIAPPMTPPPPYQAQPATTLHSQLLRSGQRAVSLHLSELGLAATHQGSARPSGYGAQHN